MEAGGNGSFGSGDDHEVPDPQRRNKWNNRYTRHQIQELEAVFTENAHPNEKQRLQLSTDLGLSSSQIKFWFQNRRTHTKTLHERADNSTLWAENDKIRCENIAMKEAMKNVICPSCGPRIGEDRYLDQQNLTMENNRLREELDRVANLVGKYTGRPISRLQPLETIPLSSMDFSVGDFGDQGNVGPSFDLDLLPGSSSDPALPLQITYISEMEKSQMADIAASALNELIRLLQTDEPLWMKSIIDGRDTLNLESYETIFWRDNPLKNLDVRVEASRDSGIVFMNGFALIDIFMDSNKWADLFPTIVSKVRTIEVLASRIKIGCSSLQLMYAELQVLSPLVPSREYYFIRSCQQIEQGLWAIVDVSYDFPSPENLVVSHSNFWRLPSGCLIQDMSNGYSKVTWVEHVEVEEKIPTHPLYKDFVHSGMAFGAERWITTLERMCERNACLMVTNSSTRNLGAVSSLEGKRSMMELTQRMIKIFCSNISKSRGQRETLLSVLNNDGVRVTVHKSIDPGQPNGVVLFASTSIQLPASPQTVFNFFRDERARVKWDVLADGDSVEEIAHIENGSHPGNRISVLQASLLQVYNASENHMLILQESCTDSSGSLVVYAPVDLPAINLAMNGDDSSFTPLLPSGFIIFPDGLHNQRGGAGASTSSSMSRLGGSVLTVAFQILVSSLPSAKLNLESVTTVNNLISTTVHQIKVGLN